MAIRVDTPDYGSGGGYRIGGTMSEINIIPLVDVILVLLLIFMLTAPLMYRGIDVNLPKSSGKPSAVEERVVLTVTKEQAIYINDKPVALGAVDELDDGRTPLLPGPASRSRPETTGAGAATAAPAAGGHRLLHRRARRGVRRHGRVRDVGRLATREDPGRQLGADGGRGRHPECAGRADPTRAPAGPGGAARARAGAGAQGHRPARSAEAGSAEPARSVPARGQAVAAPGRPAPPRREGAAVAGDAAGRHAAGREDRGIAAAAGDRVARRADRLRDRDRRPHPRRGRLPARVVPPAGAPEGRAGVAASEPAQRPAAETAGLRRDPARRLDQAARHPQELGQRLL